MDKKNKWGIVVIVLLSLLIVSSTCFYFFFDKIFSSALFFDKFNDDDLNNSKENLVKIKKLALVIANNQESEIIIEDNKKLGDYDSITWESSDSSIVDVSSCKGKKCEIKGKKIGEATIMAKDDKYGSDTIIVSVAEPDTINFYVKKNDSNYVLGIKKSAVEAETNFDYLEYYNLLTSYSCKTLDCNNLSIGNYNAIIKDSDLYQFNFKTNNIAIADDILNDYDSFELIDNSREILAYKFYENIDDDNNDNNKYILYSRKLNKEIINSSEYFSIIRSESLLEKNISVISYGDSIELYNLKENKKLYSAKNVGYVFDTSINGHTVYGFSETNFYNKRINTFYLDENFNELFDGKVFYLNNIVDNKLYGINSSDDKTYYMYDYDGSYEISDSELNNILDIYDDYILCVDDLNKLVLLGLDRTEKIELYDWNKKYNYAYNSGYGTRDGKTGYFIILENSEIEYGIEGHAIVIYYDSTNKKVSVTKQGFTGMEGKAKPVLYLYPKKTTNVKVTLDGFSTLTTTYPKYNNGWEVTAKKNGDLYDKNGKYYYGLYWEEESPRLVDFSSGFYVEKDNAIDFLEEKLSYIGLNDKERNEFIMYWLPILEKNGKSLVYFELTDELENYTHLNINPKPDSLLRVTIHIKKVDHYTHIKEENLKPFKRKGFTAVEWGGINY